MKFELQIALIVLSGLLLAVAALWWSGRWSPESRYRLRTLLPPVLITVMLESIYFISRWVYPPHWPLVSLVLVLMVAYATGNLSDRKKFMIRTICFSLCFCAIPFFYGILPAVLYTFILWTELDNGREVMNTLVLAGGFIGVNFTMAALYLLGVEKLFLHEQRTVGNASQVSGTDT